MKLSTILNQTGTRQVVSALQTSWGKLCMPFKKDGTWKAFSFCLNNSDRAFLNKISIVIVFALCSLVACGSGSPTKLQSETNTDSPRVEPKKTLFTPKSRNEFFPPNTKQNLDDEEKKLKALAKQTELDGATSSPNFSVCNRTNQVQQAVMQKSEKTDCANITAQDLKAIKYLDLQNKNITTLKSLDFQGLSYLEYLFLEDNKLNTLPEGILQELSSLEYLVLWNNKFSDSEQNRLRKQDWSKIGPVKIIWSKGS